ncbi:MAG: LytTR family transcriptional regulator [Rhodospirillales bacterium]|nr:LytTR family transcriptional regulator [Rhodospirillales bacterium]
MAAFGSSRSANDGADRAWRWGKAWRYLVVAGIALGLAGPFSTFDAWTLPARIAFWVAAVLSIGGINFVTRYLIARLVGERLSLWPVLLLTCIVAAVPGGLLLWFAVPPLLGPAPDAVSLPVVIGQVLLINLVLTFVGVLVAQRGQRAPAGLPEAAPTPAKSEPERWRERLPAEHRTADLLALEAEDHYLRVHTGAGSTLILLRLGDAMAELGPERGQQVHRSWWVARDAVERTERAGEKVALVLRGGLRVPVSRGNRAKLAAMGWS